MVYVQQGSLGALEQHSPTVCDGVVDSPGGIGDVVPEQPPIFRIALDNGLSFQWRLAVDLLQQKILLLQGGADGPLEDIIVQQGIGTDA